MPIVYFIIGTGTVLTVSWLRGWAAKRGGALGWYHWLAVGVIALWTLFVAAWIGTSLGEGFARAAGIGGLIWGGLDVLLFILVRLWIIRAVKKMA